jgi:hypothetical protein
VFRLRAFLLCGKASPLPGGHRLETISGISMPGPGRRAVQAYAWLEADVPVKLTYDIFAPDGTRLAGSEAREIAPETWPLTARLPITFAVPGLYHVALAINGEPIAVAELKVEHRAERGGGPLGN